jgi:hypothetical protein
MTSVLMRLPPVTRAQLRKLLVDAWRCQAPRQLVEHGVAVRPRAIRRPWIREGPSVRLTRNPCNTRIVPWHLN